MPKTDPDIVAQETLRLIGPDPQNWVPDRDGVDHNVFVVGGGQSGSAFAFALRRAGLGKVAVIDAAPDGAKAGVWLTSTRMHKLRTPKAGTRCRSISHRGLRRGSRHLRFRGGDLRRAAWIGTAVPDRHRPDRVWRRAVCGRYVDRGDGAGARRREWIGAWYMGRRTGDRGRRRYRAGRRHS
jgi:hypothetical protein